MAHTHKKIEAILREYVGEDVHKTKKKVEKHEE